MTGPALLVPPRARLVHIGFPKTGTTSLQSALQEARPRLPELGVAYPGNARYHYRPSIAVVNAKQRIGDAPPDMRDWRNLVRQVADAAEQRVLISSEWLCEATATQAGQVVEDLGGESVHVVATLRPLAQILPSSWQQYVQNGLTTSYEDWLDGMLRKPPYRKPTTTFWRRHRHDEVIERWAAIVGPDHVTAIVVDDSDHAWLLRRFEELLGLPEQTLQLPERTNSSLTWPQAELVRRLNQAYREQQWPDRLYQVAIRIAVAERLGRERVGEPIPTPAWALEQAAEIGTRAASRIDSLGVRVVGDLDRLGRRPDPGTDGSMGDTLPADIAALAVTQAVSAARDYGYQEGFRDARSRYYLNAPPWRQMARSLRRRVKV